MTHGLVWSFAVAPENQEAFERIYAGKGDWAWLFRQADGFLGTELLKDADRPGHYMTIDRWTSQAAFAAFKASHAEAYAALDSHCEGLTASEMRIGAFEI